MLWWTFLAMGIVTLALRASFVVAQDRIALPPVLRRALRYVPAAVLAALVAPAFLGGGQSPIGPVDARLPAGLVAVAVAWATKSVLATLMVGMATLWLLGWVGGAVG